MTRPFRSLPNSVSALSGVCGGLAYWLGIPVWVVRVIWLFAALGYGVGILPYIVFACVLPEWEAKPADFDDVTGS